MPATILPADDPDAQARAADILIGGGLVAMPTETVYGLAADATNPDAIARLYAAKGRPAFNPLIAHAASSAEALAHAEADPRAEAIAAAFWPGPLTLVLPRRADTAIAELACAGLASVALRVPADARARAVIAAVGRPLAAPSANRSGHVSPTTAAHVAADLGANIDLILDGGPCPVGVESSVVGLAPGEPPSLLRPGGVARDTIEAIVGPLSAPSPTAAPTSPGLLASHYAPRARLRLDAVAPLPGEAYLGFGPASPQGAMNLSPRGDLAEAAARLYGLLRALDATGATVIAIAPIPTAGLGEAIRDRLARAAAPRP